MSHPGVRQWRRPTLHVLAVGGAAAQGGNSFWNEAGHIKKTFEVGPIEVMNSDFFTTKIPACITQKPLGQPS